MKIFYLWVITGMVLLAGCGQAPEQTRVMLGDPPTPEQVVRGFYYEYLDYASRDELYDYYQDRLYLDYAYLDPGFIQTLDEIGSQFNNQTFDPITCSQSHPGSIQIAGAEIENENIRMSIETDLIGHHFQVLLTAQDEHYVIKEILCQDSKTNI